MSDRSDERCDIAIIGAGAAGLAAALFAGQKTPLSQVGESKGEGDDSPKPPHVHASPSPQPSPFKAEGARKRIVLLDGAKKIGAKILVSGGGRCNVTHRQVTCEDFNGPRHIVRNVLRAFDERAAVRWFDSLGVKLKTEPTGKLFPVTDKAATVLNALLTRCRSLGIDLRTDHRVTDIHISNLKFEIAHSRGKLICDRLILATGGRSLPKTGSDGLGWEWVARLGHTVTPTYPALVPLKLRKDFFHADLSGLSCPVQLTVQVEGKPIDRRSGDLLFTHFGISGPVAMDASRHWIIAHACNRNPVMAANLLPDENFESVERWLLDAATQHPQRSIGRSIGERLPQRLAEALIEHAGGEPDTKLAQLTRESRRRIVHGLTGLELPIVGDRGWNEAEVTAGGVPLDEVDYRTMTSRVVPGLYLCGEMLDVDGRIGGFNFQWAWATGKIAGQAAAKV